MTKSHSNIKAIFFDLGGVIMTFRYSMPEILANALKAPLLPLIKQYDLLSGNVYAGKESAYACTRRILHAAGFPRPLTLASARRIWSEGHRRSARLSKDVVTFAQDLKRTGYTVGIISDTVPEHMLVERKRGYLHSFWPIIFSYRVHFCKPDSHIYRITLHRARVKPKEAVFIDDRMENVLGARKIGMHGMLFKNLTQLKRDLKKFGVKV